MISDSSVWQLVRTIQKCEEELEGAVEIFDEGRSAAAWSAVGGVREFLYNARLRLVDSLEEEE